MTVSTGAQLILRTATEVGASSSPVGLFTTATSSCSRLDSIGHPAGRLAQVHGEAEAWPRTRLRRSGSSGPCSSSAGDAGPMNFMMKPFGARAWKNARGGGLPKQVFQHLGESVEGRQARESRGEFPPSTFAE